MQRKISEEQLHPASKKNEVWKPGMSNLYSKVYYKNKKAEHFDGFGDAARHLDGVALRPQIRGLREGRGTLDERQHVDEENDEV